MSLLDLYKQLSDNKNFFKFYFSTSGKNGGKVFTFINTNYRGILNKSGNELQGFANGFRILEKVEGIKRANWIKQEGKQEKEKQHVVNMRKSEFFRVVDDAYQKTSRGHVFKKMIESNELQYDEKKFICLLLLLPGYFADTPNYIFERTKFFYARCNEAGYTDEEIFTHQLNFLNKANSVKSMSELFGEEFLYLDSFYQTYDNIDFLKDFKNASDLEKKELEEYVANNYKGKNYICPISYKYKPCGNYTKNTVTDDAWILYVVKKLIDRNNKDFDAFIKSAIEVYSDIFNVSEKNIRKFVFNTDKNRSVFQVVFCKVMDVPISPLLVEKDLTNDEIKELSLSDSTDAKGVTDLNLLSGSLKKLAKMNSDYKCVMDACEMCKYFTAKDNNKNYLEIHHLIPREFANDFDAPIEILDNYVALCPNCHRKIHLAVDSERKYMINTLYNQRKEKLLSHGLNVDINMLYSYYKIDT